MKPCKGSKPIKPKHMKSIRDYKKNGNQFAYFLDCITPEPYGVETNTDKERIEFLFDTFRKEYGFNIPRYGEQTALCEWLKGLPSAISLPFYNDDIEELGKSWGYCSTPRKSSEFVANFWMVSAYRLIQIRDHFSK